MTWKLLACAPLVLVGVYLAAQALGGVGALLLLLGFGR